MERGSAKSAFASLLIAEVGAIATVHRILAHISITAEAPEPPPSRDRIVFLTDTGGTSLKPSNLVVNWRALVGEAPAIALDIADGAADDVRIIVACLSALARLTPAAMLGLDQRHAVVLIGLDATPNADRRSLLSAVNGRCAEQHAPTFSDRELQQVLSDLERMRIVKQSSDGFWKVCERVIYVADVKSED